MTGAASPSMRVLVFGEFPTAWTRGEVPTNLFPLTGQESVFGAWYVSVAPPMSHAIGLVTEERWYLAALAVAAMGLDRWVRVPPGHVERIEGKSNNTTGSRSHHNGALGTRQVGSGEHFSDHGLSYSALWIPKGPHFSDSRISSRHSYTLHQALWCIYPL